MFEKLDDRNFRANVRPLLAADERATFGEAVAAARAAFIDEFGRIPPDPGSRLGAYRRDAGTVRATYWL